MPRQKAKQSRHDLYQAIREGVAEGIVRIVTAPGVIPAADFLTAIEQGAAKGIERLVAIKGDDILSSPIEHKPTPPTKKRRKE